MPGGPFLSLFFALYASAENSSARVISTPESTARFAALAPEVHPAVTLTRPSETLHPKLVWRVRVEGGGGGVRGVLWVSRR
jgi:hypothetical protein